MIYWVVRSRFSIPKPDHVLWVHRSFSELDVKSQCTALLSWKLDFGGVSDSSFSSCAVPTYYSRSEYFYSQCLQVQMLIRTEHSLNRDEHRVILKLESISNKLEIGIQS